MLPQQENYTTGGIHWKFSENFIKCTFVCLFVCLFVCDPSLYTGVQNRRERFHQLWTLFGADPTMCKVGIGNNWGRNCGSGKEELPPSADSFLKWHSGFLPRRYGVIRGKPLLQIH